MLGFDFTKAVFQCFLYSRFVSFLHLPQADFTPDAAVGIGDIKDMAKSVWDIPVYQKGDALGAFVDPSAELIPHLDFSTSCCIRLLCVDQKLLLEIVFVVVCCRSQERCVPFCIGNNTLCLACRHRYDDLVFARHDYQSSSSNDSCSGPNFVHFFNPSLALAICRIRLVN